MTTDDQHLDLGGQPHGDRVLQDLRERLLHAALAILAIAIPVVSAVILVGAARAGAVTRLLVIITLGMLVFPTLWACRAWLGFRRSAIILVSLLALSGFLVASRGGLTVGYALLCVLAVQLAALFFGRRGAAAGLLAVLSLHILAWYVFSHEFGPPVPFVLWDPHNDILWVRHFVVLGLMGAIIALGQLYVVEQLGRSLDLHRQLAEREKAQRLALEDAKREQAHEREQRAIAEQAVERSRRIEALARVAGGVAHDFNNALTVILGTAESARDASTSPRTVETCMDEIMEAAQRAAALTNQLMTLGRQQISAPTLVSVNAFLGRLRPSIGRVLPADIALRIDSRPQDVEVCLDETGLERSILNLVLNARDAMPRGGVIRITCQTQVVGAADPQLAPGTYVAIVVSDTGVGMNRETVDRIFDPFFTTKGDKGTGLGLSSVYAFAQECGGSVDVVSEIGHGTIFTLRLPKAERAGDPKLALPSGRTPAPPVQPSRILVVEDREDVRATMVRALSRSGFDVSEAGSGDEALTVLAGQPDVRLMCIDGVMPGLSTAEAIERAQAMMPGLPVIVCSGHVQEDLLRRGIEAGRYAFLAKPFTPQDLIARVCQSLETPWSQSG